MKSVIDQVFMEPRHECILSIDNQVSEIVWNGICEDIWDKIDTKSYDNSVFQSTIDVFERKTQNDNV